MTVCIAAINAFGAIVQASDQMLSMADGAFTAESVALKDMSLCRDWRAMFAAEDVGDRSRTPGQDLLVVANRVARIDEFDECFSISPDDCKHALRPLFAECLVEVRGVRGVGVTGDEEFLSGPFVGEAQCRGDQTNAGDRLMLVTARRFAFR